MTPITFEKLIVLLVECAGDDESSPIGPDDIDKPFEDAGYDSLALLEVASRIEREHGLELPDGLLADLRTPRLYLDALNSQLATA